MEEEIYRALAQLTNALLEENLINNTGGFNLWNLERKSGYRFGHFLWDLVEIRDINPEKIEDLFYHDNRFWIFSTQYNHWTWIAEKDGRFFTDTGRPLNNTDVLNSIIKTAELFKIPFAIESDPKINMSFDDTLDI